MVAYNCNIIIVFCAIQRGYILIITLNMNTSVRMKILFRNPVNKIYLLEVSNDPKSLYRKRFFFLNEKSYKWKKGMQDLSYWHQSFWIYISNGFKIGLKIILISVFSHPDSVKITDKVTILLTSKKPVCRPS